MKMCMIIDDSPVIRKVARRILELSGFVVIEAEDGEQALEKCYGSFPDVILVDWDMPNMSGIEFIAAYRAMENSEKVETPSKILFCTSELLVTEITKAKRAGATGYIMKPYDRRYLKNKFAEFGLLNPEFVAA